MFPVRSVPFSAVVVCAALTLTLPVQAAWTVGPVMWSEVPAPVSYEDPPYSTKTANESGAGSMTIAPNPMMGVPRPTSANTKVTFRRTYSDDAVVPEKDLEVTLTGSTSAFAAVTVGPDLANAEAAARVEAQVPVFSVRAFRLMFNTGETVSQGPTTLSGKAQFRKVGVVEGQMYARSSATKAGEVLANSNAMAGISWSHQEVDPLP
jgi:hypothetical protein